MTTLVAFRAPKNGTAVVFESPENLGTTTYTFDPFELVQTPVLDVTLEKHTAAHVINIGFTVAPELTVTHALAKTIDIVAAPVLEIWTATTILGVGEFVVSPTMALTLRDSTAIGLVQTPVLDVSLEVISGSAHSTFYKTFNLVVTPEVTVGRGSQTAIGFVQTPALSVEFDSQVSGAHTYGFTPFDLVQTPALDVALEAIIIPPVEEPGFPHPVGGSFLLAPRREKPPPKPETQADRERRRLEAAAAAQAAIESARKEQIAAAEARAAEVERTMAANAMFNAPFRAAYEQQLQGMAQQMSAQGQAAMAEITRLRSELAQTKAQLQQNEEQDNEDEAIALLLLKQ